MGFQTVVRLLLLLGQPFFDGWRPYKQSKCNKTGKVRIT